MFLFVLLADNLQEIKQQIENVESSCSTFLQSSHADMIMQISKIKSTLDLHYAYLGKIANLAELHCLEISFAEGTIMTQSQGQYLGGLQVCHCCPTFHSSHISSPFLFPLLPLLPPFLSPVSSSSSLLSLTASC